MVAQIYSLEIAPGAELESKDILFLPSRKYLIEIQYDESDDPPPTTVEPRSLPRSGSRYGGHHR